MVGCIDGSRHVRVLQSAVVCLSSLVSCCSAAACLVSAGMACEAASIASFLLSRLDCDAAPQHHCHHWWLKWPLHPVAFILSLQQVHHPPHYTTQFQPLNKIALHQCCAFQWKFQLIWFTINELLRQCGVTTDMAEVRRCFCKRSSTQNLCYIK